MLSMSKRKKVFSIIHVIWLIILTIVLIGSFYLKKEYANETVEEFYFYLTNGVGSSDISVFIIAVKECWWKVLLSLFIFIFVFYDISIKYRLVLLSKKPIVEKKKKKNNNNLYRKIVNKFKHNNKEIIKNNKDKFQIKTIYPFNFIRNHRIIFTTIVSIVIFIISLNNIRFFEYIKNNYETSDFIKDNIVMGKPELINLGENNKNLVLIFVESLETTLFTKEQGGDWDYEVIPELYNLLHDEDAIYFASNDTSAGMYNISSTGWTTASVVANTSGLPFKIPIGGNDYKSSNFMAGAYTLGDLLYENGYFNELISGAKTDFGGIQQYFTKHGKYNIIDANTMNNYGYKLNYKTIGAWGINDKTVFDIAKDRLTKLSQEDKPFNETIITIDTHHVNGYKTYYTKNKYKTQYENVYATTSELIYDFVYWMKNQDWYDDTVVVIIGDHPSMQTQFFQNHDQGLRRRYNVILNSSITTENTKNRSFTALDTFPTIVGAMGGNIKGDYLGLGVNLFSDKPTLIEKYDFQVSDEIDKKSVFYNNNILGEDYYNMTNK